METTEKIREFLREVGAEHYQIAVNEAVSIILTELARTDLSEREKKILQNIRAQIAGLKTKEKR